MGRCGIRALRGLNSYLVDITQSVRTCGSESYRFQPVSGVPQASNLRSLLFCHYFNDLSHFLVSCKLLLYADDAKLYLIIRDSLNSRNLQRDEIDNFFQWASSNGLVVNPRKCFFMSFSRCPCESPSSYKIGDCSLARVDSMRNLGVIFDSAMSFENQIQNVVNKCLKTLGFIKNVSRDFRSASTLVKLYKSLLLPILTYCSPIWLPHMETDLGKLIVIKLRFVSRLTPVTMRFDDHDCTEIRRSLGLISLRNLFLRNDYILALKISS